MESNELFKSKRTQMAFLQTRVLGHASRMWQLPLTYLGAIALGITALSRDTIGIQYFWLFSFLSLLGICLIWAFFGAREGYLRSASHVARLEKELGLVVSTSVPKSHYLPYIAIMVLGVFLCIFLAIVS